MTPATRSALAAASVALAAAPLGAQGRGVVVTPFIGHATTSTLFSHWFAHRGTVVLPEGTGEGSYHRIRRLTVHDATAFGARVEIGVGRGSKAFADASYAPTEMRYVENSSGHLFGMDYPLIAYPPKYDASIDGSASAFALGLGRALPVPRTPLSLDVGAAAGARVLTLGRAATRCWRPANPPDLTCSAAPYERRYAMPEALGTVAVRTPVFRGLGLEIRGTGSTGVARTGSFAERLASDTPWAATPNAEESAPPARQRVRATTLSLGLTYRP